MSDLMNIVVTSEKRKRLILLLEPGPRTWDEIKNQLNVTASGMLPQIRILENKGLIIKEAKHYVLTDIGKLVAWHLRPFDQTLNVLESQKKYWQDHDIEALPHDFRVRLGDLKKPVIVESSIEESFEPHNQFLEMILQSDKVTGISPIVHPVYPKFFLNLAKEGKDVQLILTRNAYSKIKKEYSAMLLEGLQYNNARLFICDEDIRFIFIATERNFSLGMFLKNGVFDSKRDLVSNDPQALQWGNDLFMYYQKISHPVTREGLRIIQAAT